MLNPYLDQRPHVGEVRVHGAPMREVGRHSLHELAETAVRLGLCWEISFKFNLDSFQGLKLFKPIIHYGFLQFALAS